jgi:anti-anti-sigma regulatory factor
MLRLTRMNDGPEMIRLKVEGALTQDSVPVLEEELHQALAVGGRVGLDLRDVVYIDPPGVRALRRLPSDRAEIVDCTPLIKELLSKEPT